MSLRTHALRILEESFTPEVISESQVQAEMERITALPIERQFSNFSNRPLTCEEFTERFPEFMRRRQ